MNADPMELDKHAPVYAPKPQHPEYHAPSDDDIQGLIRGLGHETRTIARAADRAEDASYVRALQASSLG
nr:hypothetical protein [Tanacetum cinerariifolium]